MGSQHRRITNGQRAAVCGLMIAGLGFIESCSIVGAAHKNMHEHLPRDWTLRRARRPHVWTGQRLADLREQWEDITIRTTTIAAQFNVSRDTLYNVASHHGWEKRPRGHRRIAKPVREMSPKQRHTYYKLRDVIGRDAALKIVFPNEANP